MRRTSCGLKVTRRTGRPDLFQPLRSVVVIKRLHPLDEEEPDGGDDGEEEA